MEIKHTPGSWSFKCSTVISTQKPIRSSYSRQDFQYEKLYFGGYIIAERVTEADIKLIASAPELIDALIECRNALQKNLSKAMYKDEEIMLLAFNKANKAIKKATE